MSIGPTTRELLEIEVTFGEAGEIIPFAFEDTHWQSPNWEDWPADQPEPCNYHGERLLAYGAERDADGQLPQITMANWAELATEGMPACYAKLPEGWAGIQITGFPDHEFGFGFSSNLAAEADNEGRAWLLDSEYGCLVGYEQDIVRIAKRLARERATEYSNRHGHEYPPLHQVKLILVCDTYYEYSTDWETGIIDDAHLIVTILGPLDISKTTALPCLEFENQEEAKEMVAV